LITIADILVFIPTIRKTFHKPFDEELFEYYTSSLAYFFSFFALTHISLITFLYPGAMIILNGMFIIFTLAIRKSFKDRQDIDVIDSDVMGLYGISLKSAKAKEKVVYIYEKYSLNSIIGKSKAEEIRNVFEDNNVEIRQITNVKDLSFDELKLRDGFKEKSFLKYVPKDTFDITNEILIFDDTIAVYDIDLEKKLFIFKNKKFANTQKQIFNIL
jgi:hypothetical protein